MPYLFHSNTRFTLIDYTPKSGLYCQFFSSHPSKPLPIAGVNTKAYCSYLDDHDVLYVTTLSDIDHIQLQSFESSHFSKAKLIAQSTSHYTLSHPLLYELDHQMYLTYLSYQKETGAYHFIQQNLKTFQMTTLYSPEKCPDQIKQLTFSSNLTYIFFITYDTSYKLQALVLTPTGTRLHEYLSSHVPIVDYSVCYDDEALHITYVAEMYGKYQLYYFNNRTSTITGILTCLSPCKPVIFYYYHALWLNILMEKELQMLLSVDEGKSFSMPVRTSLQSNLRRCTFYTTHTQQLYAGEIYASLTSTLKLCTIAMVDVYHLHHDAGISPEIALLLEGLSLATTKLALPTASHQVEKMPSPISPTPAKVAQKTSKPKNNLDDAKKAFMEELGGWELPPRI